MKAKCSTCNKMAMFAYEWRYPPEGASWAPYKSYSRMWLHVATKDRRCDPTQGRDSALVNPTDICIRAQNNGSVCNRKATAKTEDGTYGCGIHIRELEVVDRNSRVWEESRALRDWAQGEKGKQVATDTKVFVEISEDGKRIDVAFAYNPELVMKVKRINGSRFVPANKGGPRWTVPLDLTVCRRMRELFEDDLNLGAAITEWARRAISQSDMLSELSGALDATLDRLPKVLPVLAEALYPYQRAGVKFSAVADNPLIADQPGLGKTLQAIGAIFEAGTEWGPNLVVAPKTALETVWVRELQKWQPYPVWLATGGRQQRVKIIQEFISEVVEGDGAGWLVINPDMVRLKKVFSPEEPDSENLVAQYDDVHSTEWANIVVDEAAKNSVRNPATLTAKGMFSLKLRHGGKRFALTGTPLGGRPINLWGILHYLNPDLFTSKWRWADQWLQVTDNGYGKQIQGLLSYREEAFYAHLKPYVLRRTKDEVLPQLPPKQKVDVWCDFGSEKHKQQYREMASDAMVRVGEETISATSILAEFTRLKQFSTARHTMFSNRPKPTEDSGKLESFMQLLNDRGIYPHGKGSNMGDDEGVEKVVVFSQFSQVADLIAEWLGGQGIDCLAITGATSQTKRKEVQENFQSAGGPRVLAMTTTAGGMAITLDEYADTVVFFDETWDPDDQEQAEDRVHRASRIHQVTCYYLRTKGTIEEYIMDVVSDKADVNKAILDAHRMGELKLM